MSNEKNINIGLTEITAPNLKENSYGSQLEEKFKNINDNFNKLANHEFVKGDKGDSVKFETKSLSTLNKAWKDALKNAIHGVTTEINFPAIDFPIKDPVVIDPPIKDAPIIGDLNPGGSITNLPIEDQNPIGGFNPYDFKGEIAYIKDDKDNILSSLAYVYIDPRFANLKDIKDKEELKEELAKAIDLSCVVYVTGGTEDKPIMKKLDLFPTIYYDTNINNFCWKFYGNESGIIAQGPAGKDGLNSNMVIVRRNEKTPEELPASDNVYVIGEMLVGDSWKEIDGTTIKAIDYNNCPSVVLPGEGSSQKDSYWLSVLYEDGGSLKTICSKENEVLPTFESRDLYKIFAEINPYNDSNTEINNIPGLFLPINNDNKNVHMIYAEANEEGNEENRNTLVITSVQDLDTNLYKLEDWKQVPEANMRIDMPTQINGGLIADKITINNNDNDQFGDEYSLGVNGGAVFKKDGDDNGTMIDGSTIITKQINSPDGSLIISNTINSVSIKNGEITANEIKVDNDSGETTEIYDDHITTPSINIKGGKAGELLMANGALTSNTPIKLNYSGKSVSSTLDSKNQFNIDISSLFETKVYDSGGVIKKGEGQIKQNHNYKLHIEQCLNMVHVQVSIEANKIGNMYGFNLDNNGNDIYYADLGYFKYDSDILIYDNEQLYKIPTPKTAQYCSVSGMSRYQDSDDNNIDNAGIEFMLSPQGSIYIVRYCRPRNLSNHPFLINFSFNYMI